MKSVKSKSKRIIESIMLLIFIAQYFLLLSIEIPKYIQMPLLACIALIIFYFLYSLLRLNTIVSSTNGVIVFFALNGNFIFVANDIIKINVLQNFLSRIFDCCILKIYSKDGTIKTLYLPNTSDYEILVKKLNRYVYDVATR